MIVIRNTVIAAAVLALAGVAAAAAPTGRGTAPQGTTAAAATSGQLKVGIKYHGGPVLNDVIGTNVYYIWYGNWAGDSAQAILTDMINNTTGSSWYNINTTYWGGSKTSKVFVQNKINLAGVISDSYSQGTALSDAQIQSVVANAIASGSLPSDSNALYFVLTSADVTATSGFCTQYCGWHNHASIGGADIKYSFVGNAATQCPTGCIPTQNQTSSPNGNPGADGMASVMMHELVETVSDPDLNAWYDALGQENGDKCAWKFGKTKVATNGSTYNVNFGTGQYLIQMNWDATLQACKVGR